MAKARDAWLMKVTEPIWNEAANADCNPDLIPLYLCDACEIGFNKGFGFGALTVGVFGIGALIGSAVYRRFAKSKEEDQ